MSVMNWNFCFQSVHIIVYADYLHQNMLYNLMLASTTTTPTDFTHMPLHISKQTFLCTSYVTDISLKYACVVLTSLWLSGTNAMYKRSFLHEYGSNIIESYRKKIVWLQWLVNTRTCNAFMHTLAHVVHQHLHICTYAQSYIHHTHMYMKVHVRTYTHTYVHNCIHTYIHMYTTVHLYTKVWY